MSWVWLHVSLHNHNQPPCFATLSTILHINDYCVKCRHRKCLYFYAAYFANIVSIKKTENPWADIFNTKQYNCVNLLKDWVLQGIKLSYQDLLTCINWLCFYHLSWLFWASFLDFSFRFTFSSFFLQSNLQIWTKEAIKSTQFVTISIIIVRFLQLD